MQIPNSIHLYRDVDYKQVYSSNSFLIAIDRIIIVTTNLILKILNPLIYHSIGLFSDDLLIDRNFFKYNPSEIEMKTLQRKSKDIRGRDPALTLSQIALISSIVGTPISLIGLTIGELYALSAISITIGISLATISLSILELRYLSIIIDRLRTSFSIPSIKIEKDLYSHTDDILTIIGAFVGIAAILVYPNPSYRDQKREIFNYLSEFGNISQLMLETSRVENGDIARETTLIANFLLRDIETPTPLSHEEWHSSIERYRGIFIDRINDDGHSGNPLDIVKNLLEIRLVKRLDNLFSCQTFLTHQIEIARSLFDLFLERLSNGIIRFD